MAGRCARSREVSATPTVSGGHRCSSRGVRNSQRGHRGRSGNKSIRVLPVRSSNPDQAGRRPNALDGWPVDGPRARREGGVGWRRHIQRCIMGRTAVGEARFHRHLPRWLGQSSEPPMPHEAATRELRQSGWRVAGADAAMPRAELRQSG